MHFVTTATYPLTSLQPPLLNRPGMGAKLVTYYRKQKADDQGHQKLKQGGFDVTLFCKTVNNMNTEVLKEGAKRCS